MPSYYFQVTDPSGATLLSTTDISLRKVCLDANGYITSTNEADNGVGDPEVIPGKCPGTIAVLISPFLPTPNNGNEYKVWITPVAAYTGSSGANFGFGAYSTHAHAQIDTCTRHSVSTHAAAH